MPSLRLEYQLSPNAPAQDGTRAVRLRIYAGQPPVFITVTRCAPAGIPAGALREKLENSRKTRILRENAVLCGNIRRHFPFLSRWR